MLEVNMLFCALTLITFPIYEAGLSSSPNIFRVRKTRCSTSLRISQDLKSLVGTNGDPVTTPAKKHDPNPSIFVGLPEKFLGLIHWSFHRASNHFDFHTMFHAEQVHQDSNNNHHATPGGEGSFEKKKKRNKTHR